MENVSTGDESWVFQYDPRTKQQSCQWKSATSPRPKKAYMQRSQVKVMLITFFDHHGLVHHELIPQGQTLNQIFYKKVLTLVNRIHQKQRASSARKTWILHHDNAPAHTALSVKQFLVSKEITTLHHTPYLLNLPPCDFFLFPKLKGILKGTCFKGVEDIKTSVMTHLKTIKKEELSQCFKAWSTRMEKCTKAKKEYFKGDN